MVMLRIVRHADFVYRPVQWTNESLILSPHPSMPAVVGRVFPSKDSFILPNPNEMMNSPTRYLSPSIIEASPETDNIFAYFPGDEGPGHSVIWKREGALNTWRSESSWPVNIGQGVVFAKWLNPQREVCAPIFSTLFVEAYSQFES